MDRPVRRPGSAPEALARRFDEVRGTSERLCEPLEAEDCVVQSMPDVSPTKWHLAHVTWFFETFLLKPHLPGYRATQPEFDYLFNSYYNSIGAQYPRPQRGLLTRPTMAQVWDYRARIDEQMNRLLDDEGRLSEEVLETVELGLNHEQQHQELLLMDIKHVLSRNPLFPAYRERATWPRSASPAPLEWIPCARGQRDIGFEGDGFCFDNERPRHQVLLSAFELASRLTTNGEYLEFMEDGGYRRPEHWLADGWSTVGAEGWRAPLYWVRRDDEWLEYSLAGLRPLDPNAPVCHVSLFEADAFASWSGARLATEQEWEAAAARSIVAGNFLEQELLHPRPPSFTSGPGPRQLYGDLWEWTRSPYVPYPGFQTPEGALGEYNAKFMCNQFVLKGGACVTPRSHIRTTYRNFFYPHSRWQFSGIRLARDV